jgi:hypothetical protein
VCVPGGVCQIMWVHVEIRCGGGFRWEQGIPGCTQINTSFFSWSIKLTRALPPIQHKYLNEAQVDQGPYNGNAMEWWRDVGAQRFPKLSFLASDLLSIPSSTATMEREFSSVAKMMTPNRNRLRPLMIGQVQCLRDWRQRGAYTPTEDWQRVFSQE